MTNNHKLKQKPSKMSEEKINNAEYFKFNFGQFK